MKVLIPFLSHFKCYKQEKEYTCGPACVKSVMAWFGKNADLIPEYEVEMVCDANDQIGTSRENLEFAFRNYGFNTKSKYNGSLDEMITELNNNRPVIVYFWSEAEEGDLYPSWYHYSVVLQIDDNCIYLGDPWIGSVYVFKIKEFLDLWYCDNGQKKWWISIGRSNLIRK